MNIIVDQENIRLDQFLIPYLEKSRSKIQKLIKDQKITVNNKVVSSSYIVKINDEIKVEEESPIDTELQAENIPIDIIYEDDDLLVINKKSGIVVHPAAGNYNHTLVNALLYHFNLKSDIDPNRPGIVHRLDKDTSGLMLVAKNDWIHEKLAHMIKEKQVERIYEALVCGVITHDTGTIDAPIGRDINNRQKMAVTDAPGSKNAITHFKVLKRFTNYTLIECKLETGRTHQIRVHMSYIGYPIANDPVYQKKSTTPFGQLLHSKKIRFTHPRTQEVLSFEVDPPKEYNDLVKSLTDI